MAETKTTVQYGGPGILGILGIIFIVLKLTGVGVVATWSWWWVLAPFWIPLAIALVVLLIAGIVSLVIYLTNR